MEIQGVDHVAFAVGDQTASIDWYRAVLGLTEEHPYDPDGGRLELTTYEVGPAIRADPLSPDWSTGGQAQKV